jgi:hypothetical protein
MLDRISMLKRSQGSMRKSSYAPVYDQRIKNLKGWGQELKELTTATRWTLVWVQSWKGYKTHTTDKAFDASTARALEVVPLVIGPRRTRPSSRCVQRQMLAGTEYASLNARWVSFSSLLIVQAYIPPLRLIRALSSLGPCKQAGTE